MSLNKLEHFFKLMEAVKKRPGMYINPINLSSLRNFIGGYRCSNLFDNQPEVLSSMSPSFGDWIAMKEGVRNAPDMGWVEAIMSNVSTDEEALNNFFSHLDSYVNKSENVIEEHELNSIFIKNYLDLAFVDKNVKPVKAKIVSYDANRNGVFIKFFDKKQEHINQEIYCLTLNYANSYLKDLES